MADQEGFEPPEPLSPGRPDRAGAPTVDLAAALDDLDRATRNFANRLGAQPDAVPAGPPPFGSAQRTADAPTPASPAPAPGPAREAARDSFETRMREAEREAAAYLAHAKRRADSLVNAMVGAIEREAADMRREAEVGIRDRWQAAEVDAARHVEEARRVAERMVAERQRRIAALSDGITGRAQALTAGMDDAERVREQFEAFVRALSSAADRIAGAAEAASAGPAGEPDAVAA